MAYKVFTNGSPLPASDLNTYLMNQSVMVFANSTARSAALTSPTEGMVTYLEDTNKVEVYTGSPLAWTDINDNSNAILKSTVTATGDLIVGNGNASVTRLGIGTNGQVLQSNGTTATWATPAGGGGYTLLSTTTLTGSVVNITGISSSYKNLRVVIQGASFGSGTYFAFSFGGNNAWSSRLQQDLTWTRLSGSNVEIPGNIAANTSINVTCDISNYSNTSYGKPFIAYGGFDPNGATDVMGFLQVGAFQGTGAISSCTIEAGASFTAGQVLIYGEN